MELQRARARRLAFGTGLAWSLAWASLAWPDTPIGVPLKAAVGVKIGLPVYNPATDTYDAKATVTNRSAKTFHGAFALVLEGGDKAPTLANPSGQTDAGQAYLLITLPPKGLPPAASVRGVLLQLNNLDYLDTDPNARKPAIKYKLYGFPKTKILPRAVPVYRQTPLTGDIATLDGSASTSPRGKPLNYVWILTGWPAGSFTSLDDADTARPSLFIDQPGRYQVQLLVNDGAAESNPAALDFATGNAPPVADAGAGQTVAVGDSVALDGVLSYDPENADLAYRWTLAAKPPGSAAALADADTLSPSFVADVAGRYQAHLVVNDGVLDSAPSVADIDAQ